MRTVLLILVSACAGVLLVHLLGYYLVYRVFDAFCQ